MSAGRTTSVRDITTSNARQTSREEWGVRIGSSGYPDYATPDPYRWDGEHGGTFLTPDEADEIAEGLRRAAAWARAQQIVKDHA